MASASAQVVVSGDVGPGGNEIERIPDDIGKDEGKHPCGRGRFGKPAGFNPREVLSHRVELDDIGAALEENAGHHLLVIEGKTFRRSHEKRRTAPRDQTDDERFAIRLSSSSTALPAPVTPFSSGTGCPAS